MRALAPLLAVLSTASLAGRAHAGPVFEQALAAYERVEYAQAARSFDQALASESLGRAELERAYYLLGSALLADAQTERAANAFRTLFAMRPGFRPEADASPKVRELMARVQRDTPAVEARLAPLPATTAADGSVQAEADVAAPARLVPGIEYRTPADPGRPVRVRLSCVGSRCQARLPAGTLGYRFGFITPEGALALPTDERAPTPAPARGAGTPLYKKWWLWTVVGVVLVGGITGAAVGGSQAARASSSIAISIRKDCGVAAVCPLWGAP